MKASNITFSISSHETFREQNGNSVLEIALWEELLINVKSCS